MAGQQLDAQKLMEQLDQLPSMARMGVYCGVAVAVVVLYYFTLHGGAQQKLTMATNQHAKLQGEIAEARTVASNLEGFRKRGDELREQLRVALERLPNAAELPVLLTDISGIGKKSGLDFRGFKPKPEVLKDFYAEVPIDVEFVGKYHEAGVFLDRLAKLSRIVNVTELKMTIENERDLSPDLKVKGVATTFRFVEQKTPPTGGKAPVKATPQSGKGA